MTSLLVIVVFAIVAAGISVYGPAKRIKNISVTETINEL